MIAHAVQEEVRARLRRAEQEHAIDDLLAVKRVSPELGLSPQIAPIQAFVERELERLEHLKPARTDRREIEPLLSDLFRTVLAETWG